MPGDLVAWRPSLLRNISLDAPSHRSPPSPPRSEPESRGRSAVFAIIALSVSVSLIAALLAMPPPPSGAQLAPRRAPVFSLITDQNTSVSLSQFSGRPVVIHFVILVCCSYSGLEILYMKEIQPVAAEVGAAFISIAMKSPYNYFTPQKFREILEFNWTLALDVDGNVKALYGSVETSTYVIDREGMIRYHDDETTPSPQLAIWLREVSRD